MRNFYTNDVHAFTIHDSLTNAFDVGYHVKVMRGFHGHAMFNPTDVGHVELILFKTTEFKHQLLVFLPRQLVQILQIHGK